VSNEHNHAPTNGHPTNGVPGHTETPGDEPNWLKIRSLALLVAAIGFGLFAFIGLLRGALVETGGIRQFFASYLVGYVTWLCMPIGSVVLLLIQYLTGGRWGYLLRRIFEANTRSLFVMVLLFAPVVIGLLWSGSSPYWWANPLPEVVKNEAGEPLDSGQADMVHEMEHKVNDYLNVPFALVRAGIYFGIWGVFVFFLNRWSAEGTKLQNDSSLWKCTGLAGPGIMIHALLVTVIATDLVISLEPGWASTMFPVIFGETQILCAYSFSLAVLLLMIQGPLKGQVTKLDQINLGSFMLALTLFWTYISFSQFMLVWVANLPEEIPFYLKRMGGGWEYIMIALFALHFVLPFMLLLYRDVKTNSKALFWIACGLVAVCAFDAFVWIEPTFLRDGQPLYWLMDIGAVAGVGGLYVFYFIGQYKDRYQTPTYEAHLHYQEHAHHG